MKRGNDKGKDKSKSKNRKKRVKARDFKQGSQKNNARAKFLPPGCTITDARFKRKRRRFMLKEEITKKNKDEEKNQLKELFPMVDSEIVDMIWETNKEDFDKSVESLLSILNSNQNNEEESHLFDDLFPENAKLPVDSSEEKMEDIEISKPNASDEIEEAKMPKEIEEVKAPKENEELNAFGEIEEIKTPEEIESMIDVETPSEEYDPDTKFAIAETLAENFVETYPRLPIDEVITLLETYNFDMEKIIMELTEKYGQEYFTPYTEEERSTKAKAEIMKYYLDGEEPTEEFKNFYFNNSLQEEMIKKYSKEEDRSEEVKAIPVNEYHENFPALPGSTGKPVSVDGYNKIFPPIHNSDTSCAEVYNCFPDLDVQILGYVLSFCPASDAINYLKERFPEKYIDAPPGTFKPYANKPIKPLKRLNPSVDYKQHYQNRRGISGISK